jgi:hypothetical protein
MGAAIVLGQQIGAESDRLPQFNFALRQVESSRHHAEDRETLVVERYEFTGDVRIGVEPSHPEPVTQDNHLIAPRLVLIRAEDTATRRLDSKQGEETRGGDPSQKSLRLIAASQIEPLKIVRRNLFEGAALSIVEILRSRERYLLKSRPMQITRHNDEALGILVGKGTEHDCIHDAEDRRVGPDSKGESDN